MLIYPEHNSAAAKAVASRLENARHASLWRVLACGWLLLVGVTWPLWLGETNLPCIPFVNWNSGLPAALVDTLLLLVLAACLFYAAMLPASFTRQRWPVGIATLSWLLLLAGDQLRLQPWAYQFLLILVLASVAPREDFTRCWRWLVISIYLWSAISKIDMAFVEGHGQMLLDGFLQALGTSARFWSPGQRQWAAALMPTGELLVAGLLLFPGTRRIGWGASCVMHALLMLAVGPLGLQHEWGVLLWNIFFIAQNTLLFVNGHRERGIPSSRTGWTYFAVVLLLPSLELFGLLDHWPAWAVYCARPEQVRLYVRGESVHRLPSSLQPFVQPPLPLSTERAVNYDAWVFREVHCPVYPQGRYRLALVSTLVASMPAAESRNGIQTGEAPPFRIMFATSPNRRTGQRRVVELTSLDEIEAMLQSQWLNTQPRR